MSERTKRLRRILGEAAQEGRVVITGHDNADVDSVIACLLMRDLLASWGIAARIALPLGPDRQSRRVLAWFGIDADALTGAILPQDRLVLVDHHAASHPGTVCAVIDHHPTGAVPTCPYVQIEPRGACAMQIIDLMREDGLTPGKRQEELVVTALWLDTVALRSAKITAQEAAWGRARAKQLALDTDRLNREGLGLRDMTLPAKELAMFHKKTYELGGLRVCSTTIQTDGMKKEKLEEILNVLREEVLRENAAMWVYLAGNPVAGCSAEYDVYPDGTVEEIRYDFLASRGKNVMPRVERMIQEKMIQEQMIQKR